MKPSTAILLFAKSQRESTEKQLSPNQRLNGQLWARLNRQTQQAAAASGLPVFRFDEHQQVGEHFGQRLANAFQALFAQGFEQVISIGNDSPELNSQHLARAQSLLESGQGAVLGPSHDGGIYLLGLSRVTFEALPFRQLPWQSEQLWGNLLSQLQQAKQTFTTFEVLSDIDAFEDLLRFLALGTSHLARLIGQILFPKGSTPHSLSSLPHSTRMLLPQRSLRGPPAAA